MTLRRKFFCTDWLLTNKSIYDIDTDEIPGFFHLLKNHRTQWRYYFYLSHDCEDIAISDYFGCFENE